jgi:anti-sigma B factor antagonist/stage II sporulation protein AA (anti-sigma F factor antagonist)
MNSSETNLGDSVVIAASGRIDLSNSDAFKDVLSDALSRTTTALIVDLGAVDYISSAGLRALMIVSKTSKAQSKTLAIAALQPLVLEIFTISRFNLVFPLFDTVRAAVEKLAPGALAQLDAS